MAQSLFGSKNIIVPNVLAPNSIFSADIDGDGDVDIFSGSFGDKKIAWYENDGFGNFGFQQLIAIHSTWAEDLYGIDLDGDEDIDLLYVTGADKIAWISNDGDSNFSKEILINTNTDGDLDIYTAVVVH